MVAAAAVGILLVCLWVAHTEWRLGRLEAAKIRRNTPRPTVLAPVLRRGAGLRLARGYREQD